MTLRTNNIVTLFPQHMNIPMRDGRMQTTFAIRLLDRDKEQMRHWARSQGRDISSCIRELLMKEGVIRAEN